MPIYEYDCAECEHRVEAIQRLSDPPLTECPECGGELKKRLSAPAFQFKGTGWYITDYAKKGAGDGEKKAEGKEASGDKGSEAKESSAAKSESSKGGETKKSASKADG